MSRDLVRADDLGAKVTYAKALAQAGLLPKAYAGQPGNVLLAIEMGESLGIPTMTAITSIHIVEGKPTASAGLMSALVRRAGHRLRVTGDDSRAVAEIVRADDPDFTFRSEWTMERARSAGLAGKGVWKSYPAAMLKARAISEVARDACQEALSGVIYTPEELGASVGVADDGEMYVADAPAPAPAPAPTPDADADDDIVDAEIVEGAPPSRDWPHDIATAASLDALRAMWVDAKSEGLLDLYGVDIQARVSAMKSATPIPPVFTPEPDAGGDAAVGIARLRAALKETP